MSRNTSRESSSQPGLTAVVISSVLVDNDRAALVSALEHLHTYWERYFNKGSFRIAPEGDSLSADLRILIGAGETLPEIANLENEERIAKLSLEPESFALDITKVDGQQLAVLRCADRLGLQYAVYGFAEYFLGMRFVHPHFDVGPEEPPAPTELQIVEKPSMSLRVLYETSHVNGGWLRGTRRQKAHFSDIGAWRLEDWAGNHERMRLYVDWAVKNRANVIMYDDTFLDENLKMVSAAIWEYMDRLGLKTILDVNPGHCRRDFPGISDEDYCQPTESIGKQYPSPLCIEKPGFWKVVEKKLEIAEEHAHRLAGLVCFWDEGAIGWGALEGAGDGSYSTLSGILLDNVTTRFVEPILFHGGCVTCGDKPNTRKWSQVLDHLNGPMGTVARGLPAVGMGRAHCGIADPDDALIAREVIPHLPSGSLNYVTAESNSQGADRIEAWPQLIDEANAADGGDRRVFMRRELTYGCEGDFPLAHPTSLDRTDDDFRVFTKYASTATCLGGVYTFHSLGWLLAWYSLRKQWQPSGAWKDRLASELTGSMGEDAIHLTVSVLETMRDIQLYDGLEVGEYVTYYSCWGLDLHKLAPETLTGESPFAYSPDEGFCPFIRIVTEKAEDKQDLYTSSNCTPAEERLRGLRAKLAQVENDVEHLETMLFARRDRSFWEEHLIRPLRWTAAFLKSHAALALTYCCYAKVREQLAQGKDTSGLVSEGEDLSREALEAQDLYICLRPGFSMVDYPKEVNPEVIRHLIDEWRNLITHPEQCLDVPLLTFLDRAEKQA